MHGNSYQHYDFYLIKGFSKKISFEDFHNFFKENCPGQWSMIVCCAATTVPCQSEQYWAILRGVLVLPDCFSFPYFPYMGIIHSHFDVRKKTSEVWNCQVNQKNRSMYTILGWTNLQKFKSGSKFLRNGNCGKVNTTSDIKIKN